MCLSDSVTEVIQKANKADRQSEITGKERTRPSVCTQPVLGV